MKTILLAATFFCFVNLTNGQAGRLDPSFGNHGIAKTDLGKNYTYSSSGNYVLTHADGSIFLIGQTGNSDLAQGFITKRHPDGSIDSSYGRNGFSENVKMAPFTAILQPDGKIVVVGSFDLFFNSYRLVLARFNADGSLDSSFSEDGIQNDFTFSVSENLSKIEVRLYNGKIIVSSGPNVSRYNGDGSLDSTFNGGRITSPDFGREFFVVDIEGLAVQSDGKIVIAGNIHLNFGDSSTYVLARYKTNGTLDSTFGDNGTVITHLNSINNIANSVVVRDNGKILVGGGSLVQYNSNGSLDSSFSEDGVVVTDFSPDYYMPHDYSLTLEPGGKIVISGNIGNQSTSHYVIARYNTDGSTDNTFGEEGIAPNLFNASSAFIQKDGKIIVAGYLNADFALARYTANGTFDNTFGKNGNVTGNIQSGYTIYKASAIQKDGKIVAAGRTWNGSNFDFVITRYNTDGTTDNTFGAKGAQITDFASKDDYANSVAIQSDGKIVVVGYSGERFDSSLFSIARYNTDGSLDNTFSDDGKSQTNFGSVENIAYSVAIQSDGKILAAGDFGVARFNTDGRIDNTFDEDGKQTKVFSGFEYEDYDIATPYSIAIQSDGKIVAGGRYISSTAHISVARLNADGSRDSSFTQYNRSGNGSILVSVAIQNDGKIVAGGYTYYRGSNGNYLVRLDTSGNQEISSSTDFEDNQLFSFTDLGNLVAIQNDGKAVVLGAAITRYNTDGSLDNTFGNNGILQTPVSENNTFINSIAIEGDKLYGVGSAKAPGNVGLVARYLLDNSGPTPPTLSLTAPADNAIYIAPVNLQLAATAADADGTITKVEFYNYNTLLYTDTIAPYTFTWKKTPEGYYTLTAKATDNSGLTATSTAVHVTVVSNKAPIVSIINPVNNRTFAAPAFIHFEAAASDDGKITRVEFYSGSTLLATEYKAPYTFVWKNLPVGIYTVTAVATDNFGARTTSAPVTVKVKAFNPSIVSSKPNAETNDFDAKTSISLKAWPNPASKIVTISTIGLQQNKPTTISILSATGIVVKTIRSTGSNQSMQLDVSSLTSGVYTIKLLSGDNILYKQFVKL